MVIEHIWLFLIVQHLKPFPKFVAGLYFQLTLVESFIQLPCFQGSKMTFIATLLIAEERKQTTCPLHRNLLNQLWNI